MARPNTMPTMPPVTEMTMASARNWRRISRLVAPTALRMPISRMREVTVASMMFMMPMPLLQHAFDRGSCGKNVLRGGHRNIDFIHRGSRPEETADCVWNQHGVFLNFRLAERVHTFFEDADNRERKAAAQLDDLADGGGGRAVDSLRQFLGDDTNFIAAQRIFGVEEASGENLEIAHLLILRIDAEDENVALLARTHVDAISEG